MTTEPKPFEPKPFEPNQDLASQSPPSRGHSIQTIATREVYRNPWLRLREDRILRSNGNEGIYGVVDKEDCAIILPIQEPDPIHGKDGLLEPRIWLVEQFRYPVQQRYLELPQGGWEMDGVDPEELARGELKEEIGMDAGRMVYLGWTWIAYGFTRQKQHVFLATGLTPTSNDPDPEEHDLVVHSVTLSKFESMMLDGSIRDNCTLAAWGLYLLWKARQQNDKPDQER